MTRERCGMTTAFEANGLGKRYGRRWALRGVDLAIPAGRVVALVGPNGAGKTTLLETAVGLVRPTVGAVRLFGMAPGPRSLPAVGFVAQDKPLYPDFRVVELLRLARRLNHRWDESYARRRLDALGIDPRRRAAKLSGGQRAQVALTLALAKRPRLLLLDEPTANLDPLARRDFLDAVAGEARTTGLTVVHSSHSVAELNRDCDHLVVIRDAAVVLAGDVARVVPPGRDLEGVILAALGAPSTAVAA
jgi:ABC-2 type transport system ATP-binding protein